MKLFGKKLFGKSSDDDDEDDEDFDFDESDFEEEAAAAEADELNEALAAQSARNSDTPEDEMAGLGMDDLPPDDLPPDDLPPADATTDDMPSEAAISADGVDAGDDIGSGPPEEEGAADIDMDDIDFDDEAAGEDDEDFDDDDFDEDEDDEDGERRGLFARPAVRYAAIGLAVLLLLGGFGVASWLFVFSGAEEEVAAEEELRGVEIALPESGSGGQGEVGSLNDLTAGGGLQPPVSESASSMDAAAPEMESTLLAETPDEATKGDVATFAQSTGDSGLNALGGLNAFLPGTTGSGVVIPVTTASSFSRYPDIPGVQPLGSAPEADLMEIRGEGAPPLPKKGQDGRTPFDVYARPAEIAEGQRVVALVVTDLGLNRAGTIAAIRKLPPEVTLSFSPYAEELGQWMVRARRAGHEILVGLPMESDRFPIEDPGPFGLMSVLSEDQNLTRFYDVLGLFQGYIGIEVVMGGQFDADPARVRPFIQVLADRGLMVLDSAANERSAIPRVARELSVPLAVSDFRIDTVMARSAIEQKLKQVEDTALARGIAVGTTAINPAIVDRLTAWFVALQINGIKLVPLSALVNRQDFS